MKNLFKQIFPYMVVASFLSVHAEDNKLYTDPRVQISLPSTEAQSLGKFSEIPVDLYTGRTNINIPLFTIKHNDIEVPISISYHGGGIKVDDDAGLVGLGWTLNAGGVVSRIVQGLPDDLYNSNGPVKGFNHLSTREHEFINALKQMNPAESLELLDNREKNQLMSEFGIAYDENKIDVSPDNYIISVLDYSGAFVGMTADNVQSNGGYHLKYLDNGNIYRVTDVKGLVYTFSHHEQRNFPYRICDVYNTNEWSNAAEYNHHYTSAWWLSSIHNIARDSIKFEYVQQNQIPPRSNFYSHTQFTTQNSYQQDTIIYHNYSSYAYPFVPKKDSIKHQLLSSISTPYCRLDFRYSPQQNNRVYRLDTLALYSTIGDVDTLIERYIFSYAGVFSAARLYQLTHECRNNAKEYYTFTYHSTNAKGIGADNKDHWGFFSQYSNGRYPNKEYLTGISNLAPMVPHGISSNVMSERYADNENASNNMLESITYPSGLVVKFTWEPHTFSLLSPVGYDAYQFYKEYDYLKTPETTYEIIYKDIFSLCGKENNENLSIAKYLTTDQYINIDLSSYFYNHEVWNIMDCVMDWRENYMASDRPVFCIEYEGEEILHFHLDSASIQSMINQHSNHIAVQDYGAGMYKFILKNPRTTLVSPHTNYCVHYHEMFNKPETSLGKIFISITEQNEIMNPYNVRNVGGVRIKQIEYKDGQTPLFIKNYSYIDSTRHSSGVLSYSPRYASTYPIIRTITYNQYVGGIGNFVSNLLTLRSNGLPYVLNSGGHIEYRQVTEYTVQQVGHGSDIYHPIERIDYYYCTSVDSSTYSDLDETNATIYIPTDQLQLTSRKHQRGHLKKKVEFTDEIKTTTYNYQILEKPTTNFYTGSAFVTADFQGLTYGYEGSRPYKNYGITKYRVIPYNKRLINQQTVGDKTNIYHAYTYANDTYASSANANLPLTHTYVTSEGDTLIEHYSYYRETNMIDSCLITKNGYVVDGYKLDYDEANRVIKKYKPKLCPTSLPSINTVEWDTLETYLYDSETSKITLIINHKMNVRTIYVWSYKGQYPIAEINSAEPIYITDSVGGALEMRNLRDSSQPDISILDNLRDHLPNATIKTMTYEPFVGITSYTDEKGYTQYYKYDDFRQLQEIYEIVGDTIHILKRFDYQVKNR